MRVGHCGYRCWAITLIILTRAAAALADPPSGAALRVGTSGDYKPFSFRDTSGALAGFDVAVAQRLAADLGRPVEFVPFRWPDLVAQLRFGKFDIAMSGITVRADRAVRMSFSRPYVITGAVAVIRAADGKRFHDVGDLDRQGVRIAVNRGGHLEQVARRRFAHARLVPVNQNLALADLLQQGRADAVVSEELEAHTWPAGHFAILGPFTRDRKAYALRREAPDLLRQVNDWLAAREADGWLNEQRRRWFGERAELSPQQAGFEALVAAVDLRLQLMPLVAAAKRREHLPIEDPAQEARVLERVRSAGEAAGLNRDDVAEIFRLEMEMAKAVEHAAKADVPGDLSLAEVRAAVAAVSDQVIHELARCQQWLSDARLREHMDRSAIEALSRDGAPSAAVTKLLAALHHLRRAQP